MEYGITTAGFEGMGSAVVLLSGGLDSSTLLHFVVRRLGNANVRTISFLYGQKHSRELEMAGWQAENSGVMEHREIDVSFLGDIIGGASALTGASVPVPDLAEIDSELLSQPPTYVPNRNMILLSLAAAYAESNDIQDIFYGAQAQDRYGYWDCTSAFLNQINGVLGLNRVSPIRVHAPFVDMPKSDVVKIGLEMGVDYGHTWTCYRGGGRPCGTCPSCTERIAAFEKAGAADPLMT